jgi:type IV secretory pathway VirB10-like protein
VAKKPQRHMRAPIDRPNEPNADAESAWLGRVSEAASALAATRVGDQISASTLRSKISVECTIKINPSDRLFDPEGPLVLHSRLLTTRPEAVTARLVVHSSHAVSGEPAPLGLELQGEAEGAIVIIAGLAPGMEVSMGTAVGADAWEVPVSDLGAAWIGPPEAFVGSVDLVAELRLPDEKIADRQVMHFEWTPPISPSPAPNQLARDESAQPQLDREELPAVAQVSPDVPQLPSGREVISAAPPISPEPAALPSMASQDSAAPETAVEERAAKDSAFESPSPERSAQRYPKDDSRRSQSATESRRDGRQTFKGFWDWSR